MQAELFTVIESGVDVAARAAMLRDEFLERCAHAGVYLPSEEEVGRWWWPAHATHKREVAA